jgi:hypothetical protein
LVQPALKGRLALMSPPGAAPTSRAIRCLTGRG